VGLFDDLQNKPIDVPTGESPYVAPVASDAPAAPNAFGFTPKLDYVRKADAYEVLDPGSMYLKNSLAQSVKKTQTMNDMFAPQNLALTTDEYVKKQNEQAVAPAVAQALQDTAHLSDEEFYARLDRERALNGQMPLKPEQAQLQQPNNMQMLAAALGSILFPEHAMDTAALPYQYGLQDQAKRQGLNNQEFASRQAQWENQMRLEEQANQQLNQRDLLRYQTDVNRQESAIDRNFKTQLQKAGFSHDLTMQSLQFKQQFDLANLGQKHDIAMTLLRTVEQGDPVQSPWASTMLRGMGYDVAALQGKPLAIQAQEIQIQTAKNEEERRGKLFPSQLSAAQNQALLLGKEVKWFDKLKELDYRRGSADIANTYSMINDRTWQHNFATSEQQRQYLSELNGSVTGGMKALGSQLDSIEEEIRRTITQEAEAIANPALQKEIAARRTQLEGQRDKTRKALEGMQTSFDNLNESIKEKAGVAPGATDLGALYLGVPYSWGGGSLTKPTTGIGKGANTVGFDCSGLTRAVAYNDFGVTIPRTAKEQFEKLPQVDPKEAQTGDFMYWSDGSSWHTGILIFKDGQPYVRQAPNTGSKVQDTPLDKFKTSKKFMGTRRAWKEQEPNIGNMFPWLNGGN